MYEAAPQVTQVFEFWETHLLVATLPGFADFLAERRLAAASLEPGVV